jgi:DNA replication protein DnaD
MYDWLGLPVEVILKLLEYCVGIGKKSMAYIEKVAVTWHKDGITTLEAAQAYLALETQRRSFAFKAKQIFGIDSRNLTSKEEGLVSKWQAMGVSEALLQFAFDYTVDNTGKLAFAYMDKVLCAWVEAGAFTPQQAQRSIAAASRGDVISSTAIHSTASISRP